ncbi:MAG: XRE family transcriptional regulator [Brevundimonas sp.]|nr:MAG: XRE family transcriptional regulator [Brevundimonas sp.]
MPLANGLGLTIEDKAMIDDRIADNLRIGKAIRDARSSVGWTQTDLARALGVRFQQVQKYEHGLNRVAVTTLLRILAVLNVTPARFFEAMDRLADFPRSRPTLDPQLEELRADYEALEDPQHRRLLRETARALRLSGPLKRSL